MMSLMPHAKPVHDDPAVKKAKADAEVATARAEQADRIAKAMVDLPAVMPTVAVTVVPAQVGFLVEAVVWGQLFWQAWRAVEPTEMEMADLLLAARQGVAARSVCANNVLATDLRAALGGTAPATKAVASDTKKGN